MERARLGDHVYYGTSSWSEPSWVGPFYPPGTAAGEMLAHYATRFRTVEADVTYYRIPSKSMVEGWRRKTPEGFLLSAKFPRAIVHAGEGKAPDPQKLLIARQVGEETKRFLESMSLLGDRCGPLVLQFPYFGRAIFPSGEPFLERLEAFLEGLPDRFRYAVEIRNPRWLGPALLDVLRRRRAALVLADIPYMPHPADLPADLDLFTAGFLYLRLIGDRKAVEEKAETFERVVVDRSDRLRRWADWLRPRLPHLSQAFLYANNHFAGHAPETIRQLVEMLRLGPEE